MQTETLEIGGMASAASAPSIIKVLTGVDGVQSVKVSFNGRKAVVEFDEKRTAKPALLAALKAAGFNDGELKRVEPAPESCCGGCCNG
jgi:copper chaperone CopZ